MQVEITNNQLILGFQSSTLDDTVIRNEISELLQEGNELLITLPSLENRISRLNNQFSNLEIVARRLFQREYTL